MIVVEFIALKSRIVSDFGPLSIILSDFVATLQVFAIVGSNPMGRERERERERDNVPFTLCRASKSTLHLRNRVAKMVVDKNAHNF